MDKYIRNEQYDVTTNFDNEWIILNTDKFTVTKINEIGGFCWSLLKQPQSIDTLVQAIKQEYEEVNESVEEDIHHFLSELLTLNLINYAS
ncbi:PqqD family protein [Bacillus sp. AFS055030]|uniref:PqqD family protein n=1 Tax=Bacillus sp. AFS055030 TaxID=2033507 RepID=UPI000BFE7F32|nr:PqqD family protein [Bacillus sp. AFS055030]PGL70340.1 PqqD family protein [Bacillus sp. AFS055030]